MSEVLGRDGHLTDLALERFLAGELQGEALAEVEAHLAECEDCADRVAAAQLVVPAFEALQAPDLSVLPEPANRPWGGFRAVALAAVALAGAGVWVSASQGPDDPGVRLKGAGLALEVFVDGEPPRQLEAGDEVVPGDKLGFRVRAGQDGHLIVLGRDETGSVYPCLPARPGPSQPHARSDAPVDVEAAVVLDAVLGTEQFVAIHCDSPPAWDELAEAVRTRMGDGGPLAAGCVHEVVEVEKVRARMKP